MSGTTSGIGTVTSGAASVDPAPCNALTDSPDGLLVPSTALAGAGGSGTAVGAGRSVNVDVVAPAAGDCPQEWQVGARLTPPFGEVLLDAFVNLVATASGEWVDTGMAVDLPGAGVYEVSATLHTVIATNPGSGVFNLAIVGRLWDVTGGAAIEDGQYTAQQTASNSAPTTFTSDADLCTFHKFVTTAGPMRVRLEVARINTAGTPVATTGLQTLNSRLAFKKISD
ncbi:hypothetical protein OG234_13185 [Streptomyces sp. NBC_01420]|uniref:hypothetical protein n=1 Tax=Streptomyces sp. NBC_01420 TaxID=2903858 RepID=UPI003246F05C